MLGSSSHCGDCVCGWHWLPLLLGRGQVLHYRFCLAEVMTSSAGSPASCWSCTVFSGRRCPRGSGVVGAGGLASSSHFMSAAHAAGLLVAVRLLGARPGRGFGFPLPFRGCRKRCGFPRDCAGVRGSRGSERCHPQVPSWMQSSRRGSRCDLSLSSFFLIFSLIRNFVLTTRIRFVFASVGKAV